MGDNKHVQQSSRAATAVVAEVQLEGKAPGKDEKLAVQEAAAAPPAEREKNGPCDLPSKCAIV